MPASKKSLKKISPPAMGTAEAFYVIFRALTKKDKMAVASYIFDDEDIRSRDDLPETPNQITLASFVEAKSAMPLFQSIDDLKKDLMR